MKLMKKRRGSTFVEAAVVLPICLLAIISVICILMFLFLEVETKATCHVAVNAAMGEKTKTTKTYEHISKSVQE